MRQRRLVLCGSRSNPQHRRAVVGLILDEATSALDAESEALIAELNEALAGFESNPEIGCTIITGSEKAFAAGADVKEMAETICMLLDAGDQLPAWVQDLVASAHTDLEHVKDYLVGDEKLRSYEKKDVPPMGMPTESRRRGKALKEGHSRITEKEMREWMNGNWGFDSEHDDDEE